ncbi:RHS repeat protein [Actinocrinis puniceicyclus]|uniref:RHS repeat protein n=1 Tax=Actinocrinis puniceicyclus TaxID=977794 RepID=A0A8J7WT94_9ACTN|nr:DUF6531 domain-containing protein [Actinocrinis puniceicyclus]MBS2966072.1 RHS repeat protein [Actinocrinis puniceicyclus]
MAGGEEKAIFVALRDDAQKALKDAGEKAGSFAEETAQGAEKNLDAHLATENEVTDSINAIGKRPAEAPLENPVSKMPKTSGGGGRPSVPEGDVTDAGVSSGGARSAETGATDPVDVVSGQLLEKVIDFSLPGVLPLVLRRTYASGYTRGALFGPGWSSTVDMRLVVGDDGTVRFLGDDAQCLDYGVPTGLRLGLPAYPAYGERWALERDTSAAAWTVTDPRSGLTYRFAAEGGARPLEAIRDRSGNEISFHRDERGLPYEVEHSGGYRIRTVLIETAGGVRLAGYELDSAGALATLVGFEYDQAGRLVRVIDSTGAAHGYEYDAHDRICAWTDRRGYRYPYRYDEAGRVVETGEPGGFKHALIAYDPAARVTRVTDALGHTSAYHYDRFQQITKIVDPLGAETLLHKDAFGRLLKHTTPLGHTTAFEYDTDGNRTRILYPDGQRLSMAYAGPGQLAQVDFADGARWRYIYDERGNVLSETDPLGATTVFGYDGHGALVTVTDPLGAVQRYENDAAGLPIAAVDPHGARTTIARDTHGRVTAITTPDGAVTRIERDSEGRVLARIAPDGAVTRYSYDVAGNQVAIADPSGRCTRVDYGPFHIPVARVNPDGTRHIFAYDAELRLTGVTGPTGLTWSYRYDENGQRVVERDFDGREQTYAFDQDGRLTTYTAPGEVTSSYQRDAAGRLVELRAGEQVSRFGYDPVGRLVRAENEHATVTIERDLLGRAVREQINGRSVAREYDAAGNLSARTTPSGAVSQWAYDAVGDAVRLAAGPATVTFARDMLGREIRRDVGQVALDQSYDTAGRLAGQRLTAGGRVLQERTYGYDADGLPMRIIDLLRGTRDLQLDRAGQITAVLAADHAERYSYDPVGNLAAADIAGVPTDTAAAAVTGRYTVTATRVTAAGRTQYTYDARGNLATKTRRTLSGQRVEWSYTWDAHNRLTAVTRPDGQRWTYCYDALGRRIEKARLTDDGRATDTVRFAWDGTTLVEQTTTGDDGTTATTTWDYEPAGHRPAAQRRTVEPANTDREAEQQRIDAQFWAIVTDLAGTPQELVCADGSIAWARRALLWGRPLDDAEPGGEDAACPIGFPGQYHDLETGLYYNNQRYYDPDTASYLSPDPVGLEAAPNPTRYVANPMAGVDPLGLTPQGPTPRMKTDDELQADADAIHEGFRTAYGDRTYNARTVSTFQGEDGSLYYSVNGSKSYPGMDETAKNMGYSRVFGTKYMAPEQTDAEQIMLNAVDKKAVPDTGRIATSRVPCQEFRNTGKPAQNCAARIASYPRIRLVGRFASP